MNWAWSSKLGGGYSVPGMVEEGGGTDDVVFSISMDDMQEIRLNPCVAMLMKLNVVRRQACQEPGWFDGYHCIMSRPGG